MVSLCPKCKKILKFSYGKLACPTCSYTEALIKPTLPASQTSPVPKQCPSCGRQLKHMTGIGWVCSWCTPPRDRPVEAD